MTKCQRFDTEQMTTGGKLNYSISSEVWSTENHMVFVTDIKSCHQHTLMHLPSFTSRTEEVNAVIKLFKNMCEDWHFYCTIMV